MYVTPAGLKGPGNKQKFNTKTSFNLDQRKTEGGPLPAEFTPAEELALSNNEGRLLMVGVEGVVSTDPGGSRSHHLFIQDNGENVVLLPPQNQQLPHTEECLGDETLSVYSESALAVHCYQ
ncbi:hypothetical protein JOQ06_026692 [Pogonophryne albipinna]|uniref:Uncharacterized protein n=1 Tax=Pogonophryne albipinna TaxID=1090488 RepID=A0AAD6FNT6_9TELE|nr:hypothetical protein JOQ06_026692 [Pogonophryne albipinna]